MRHFSPVGPEVLWVLTVLVVVSNVQPSCQTEDWYIQAIVQRQGWRHDPEWKKQTTQCAGLACALLHSCTHLLAQLQHYWRKLLFQAVCDQKWWMALGIKMRKEGLVELSNQAQNAVGLFGEDSALLPAFFPSCMVNNGPIDRDSVHCCNR